ncbi:hypothetical protein [Desertibacillus haloalkaliphilus]|uniref:hypothetical protein n=1 Tax=Desertibacillus haloalkaliphilus TaxID=1328930 RepID=UPI001C25A1FA|nr:hypothetical protein [Desertibacillus haloalkaliphilus]MBU8905457.1 hypothetical protein [Desertibacillus haloalkaliphilus]
MFGVVFGLFAASVLFIYGMIHTLLQFRKVSQEHSKKWRNYSIRLGLLGLTTLTVAVVLFKHL